MTHKVFTRLTPCSLVDTNLSKEPHSLLIRNVSKLREQGPPLGRYVSARMWAMELVSRRHSITVLFYLYVLHITPISSCVTSPSLVPAVSLSTVPVMYYNTTCIITLPADAAADVRHPVCRIVSCPLSATVCTVFSLSFLSSLCTLKSDVPRNTV